MISLPLYNIATIEIDLSRIVQREVGLRVKW
jgi:hypothetical protein